MVAYVGPGITTRRGDPCPWAVNVFAAGVMVAASCWSLLVPSIESGGVGRATIGFLAGAAFLYAADQALPHLHGEFPDEARAEGPHVAWQRSVLLMLAMTLHNFPEGMAVGISFGGGDLGSAVALAIGIFSRRDLR